MNDKEIREIYLEYCNKASEVSEGLVDDLYGEMTGYGNTLSPLWLDMLHKFQKTMWAMKKLDDELRMRIKKDAHEEEVE